MTKPDPLVANSYMFPQRTRMTDSPRRANTAQDQQPAQPGRCHSHPGRFAAVLVRRTRRRRRNVAAGSGCSRAYQEPRPFGARRRAGHGPRQVHGESDHGQVRTTMEEYTARLEYAARVTLVMRCGPFVR